MTQPQLGPPLPPESPDSTLHPLLCLGGNQANIRKVQGSPLSQTAPHWGWGHRGGGGSRARNRYSQSSPSLAPPPFPAVQAEPGPATHPPDTESSSLDTGCCLLHRPSSAPGGHCPPGSWGHTMRKALSAPQTLSSCHPQLLFGTKRAAQAPPPLLPRSAHLEEFLFLSYSVLEAVPGG